MQISMDHHLHQWWCQQQQSDQQQESPAKVVKLAAVSAQKTLSESKSSARSLFVREPNFNNSSNTSNLSAAPAFLGCSTATAISIPETYRMGVFSLAQLHELEQQALIFKYMLAGASVPPDLVLSIRKSLLNSPTFYPHQHYHLHHCHHNPAMLQSGYWGRTTVDSEPGRCRRTDGKKWRCSRDVVSGQKYCERHMHRGRNRSRKPVESLTPLTSSTSTNPLITNPPTTLNPSDSISLTAKRCLFLPGSCPSTNLFQLNHRSPNSETGSGRLPQSHHQQFSGNDSAGDGKILRHFFDESPRKPTTGSTSPAASNTHLSISISARHPSSDFSLKLSTGGGDGDASDSSNGSNQQQPPAPAPNWAVWENHQQEGSMGGPLAEALRSSSASTCSPTSVLLKPYGLISETLSVST